MAIPHNQELPSIMDSTGVVVAKIVMAVYFLTVLIPYALIWTNPPAIPEELFDIIKSNKSTVDLITTAVVMFYFGASVQRRKDQDTVSTLVKTNAAAQAALAPLPGAAPEADKTVPIGPGETVAVVGTEESQENKT